MLTNGVVAYRFAALVVIGSRFKDMEHHTIYFAGCRNGPIALLSPWWCP